MELPNEIKWLHGPLLLPGSRGAGLCPPALPFSENQLDYGQKKIRYFYGGVGIMAMRDFIPAPAILKNLESEELAGYLLPYLNTGEGLSRGIQTLCNFVGIYRTTYKEADDRCASGMAEAWQWLLGEGLIAHYHEPGMYEWVFVTRRGKKLTSRTEVEIHRRTNLIPTPLLHPKFLGKVLPIFVRGDYDTAIFQAFKEVEIAVRVAGNFKQHAYGPEMMKAAFEPGKGKLIDPNSSKKEQEGFRDLFAGAIAAYKGPSSHQIIEISDREAVEKVLLASHLLFIVEQRAAKSPETS